MERSFTARERRHIAQEAARALQLAVEAGFTLTAPEILPSQGSRRSDTPMLEQVANYLLRHQPKELQATASATWQDGGLSVTVRIENVGDKVVSASLVVGSDNADSIGVPKFDLVLEPDEKAEYQFLVRETQIPENAESIRLNAITGTYPAYTIASINPSHISEPAPVLEAEEEASAE